MSDDTMMRNVKFARGIRRCALAALVGFLLGVYAIHAVGQDVVPLSSATLTALGMFLVGHAHGMSIQFINGMLAVQAWKRGQ